jgi:hypothetical protein
VRVGRRADAVDARVERQRDPVRDGLGRECERRGERADDVLVGDGERAGGTGPEMRLERVQLVDRDRPRRDVAVPRRFLGDADERVVLLARPGDEQRARSARSGCRAAGRAP